ncbi:hypothetical protein K7X08_013970 [Anisodus acutangulus]|uniref:Uncharacterized protein n=1 Tax=Anisodus acutangulus TaxID=402998 RepID=A0A9Q1LMK5_9SOLA|nr:hypothetical protein K7X08_013970 [Anisodus acutangulus]
MNFCRFSEVAKLKWRFWLDIRGKIETQMLSKRTKYVAYRVFKLEDGFYCDETANAYVRFVDCDSENEAEKRASVVCVSTKEGPHGEEPDTQRRVDGWMEIAVGNFFNDTGEDGGVEARFESRRPYGTDVLIVQGMEFRPE